jgi:U3 small nucleolar RNA-associated protein 7
MKMATAATEAAPLTQDTIKAREAKWRLLEAQKKYGRGKMIRTQGVKDKKLQRNLMAVESRFRDAALKAKDAEILLENEAGFLEPENEIEKTYKIRQADIKESVGIETAKMGLELKLDQLGPYRADYTRNGRNLLLAGQKGHVTTIEWRAGKLGCELQLRETVRDAKWLHNNQFFAVAQKKYVYIYDHAGVELHCLRKHVEATHLEFLPYHFLLASAVRVNPTSPSSFSRNKWLIWAANRQSVDSSNTRIPLRDS